MSLLVTALIAFLSIIIPGFFLALALLRKTKLNMIEITTIGFMFGLIFPPTLTWMESYLMNYVHVFTFSASLYAANVVVLTLIGIALCIQQGILGEGVLKPFTKAEAGAAYRQRIAELRDRISDLNIETDLVREHQSEEEELSRRHLEEAGRARSLPQEERTKLASMHVAEEKKLMGEHEREERMLLQGKGIKRLNSQIIWGLLIFLMLFTFATRMLSIGIAPHFFEFDPYFDMQSTEFVLTHGYQWLYDTSAWPTAINGTPHRIEPIVPYLEAYWYQISNPPANQISTALLSDVGSVYPPITAALLVFIVFMFLYHMYGDIPAIIGAALAAAMPALTTTFIAGEQLLEPWGIFAMFFFYAAYMLAVQNPKEKRFAVLAGIAFVSSFLGAHYYTVIAGVFAIYIAIQGVVDVLRKREMKNFYIMNLIIIGIIVLFYIPFGPYGSVLANKIPSVAGVPIIVSFPLLALVFVFLLERLPVLAKERGVLKNVNTSSYLGTLAVLGIITLLLILFTPLGTSVDRYLALISHYTTPSIALFMTVQEYEPTGFNFDFGSAGFGPIGASFYGVNAIVWFVLLVFTALAAIAVIKRDSKGGILALAAVWPLAVAGMAREIKYLPHFGVGYILALGLIVGELLLMSRGKESELLRWAVIGFAILIVVLESTAYVDLLGGLSASCPSLNTQGNALAFDVFCNTVPNYWLNALAWMKQNVGPMAPRVLSWWDYGDWINWFGNSNAVLRGDNSIALLDYETAARFVLGSADGYGPQSLANFSNNVAYAKYVLFDDQLTVKWQSLNFLACIGTNQTSRAFAIQAGNASGRLYWLGTSQCELKHAPAYALIPVSSSNINSRCQFTNSTAASKIEAYTTIILADNQVLNQTYCAPANFTTKSVRLLDTNGRPTNILIVPSQQFFAGVNNFGGEQFLTFIPIYLPNGPNGTITDAPTEFYNSNYYRGFYLGQLPGFHIAYPSNFTGVNYVNGTWPVVIYALDNYTGPLPTVAPKPAWVVNNFTMPG